MDIYNRINAANNEIMGRTFKEILKKYINPAFGSMSKKDFEILLFTEMQNTGIIEKKPDVYNVISCLKVTRQKARNLIYESQMRNSSERELDDDLKKILLEFNIENDGEKIHIEITNPLLIDHIKWKLRTLNCIADSSFSTDIVRMSKDAYVKLFCKMIPEHDKEELKDALIKCGAENGIDVETVVRNIIRNAKNASLEICKQCLCTIITSNISNISNIRSLFISNFT